MLIGDLTNTRLSRTSEDNVNAAMTPLSPDSLDNKATPNNILVSHHHAHHQNLKIFILFGIFQWKT